MDEELRAIEDKLEQLDPVAMPDDMLARMEQAMEKWQESVPLEEKVVQFQAETEKQGNLSLFNVWASAAAVALVAAASIMVFGGVETNSAIAENSVVEPSPVAISSVPTQNIDHAVPASNARFQTRVTSASNGVITYDALGRPMRVMQLDFEDEVIVRDRQGNLHKVKQPRVEYYAVPVEIH